MTDVDIRLKVSFKDHRKRKRLARILGADGVLALIDLMLTAAEQCPVTGHFDGYSVEDIEIDAQWGGAPGAFVDAAVKTGWLVVTESGIGIANWSENQPFLSAKKERSEQGRKAAEARYSKQTKVCSEHADSMPTACPEHAPRMPLPSLPSFLPSIPTNPPSPEDAGEPRTESEDPEGKASLVTAQPPIEAPWDYLAEPSRIQKIVRRLTASDATPAHLATWRAAIRDLEARNADFEAVLDAIEQRGLDEETKFAPKLPEPRRLNAQWFLDLVQRYGTNGGDR